MNFGKTHKTMASAMSLLKWGRGVCVCVYVCVIALVCVSECVDAWSSYLFYKACLDLVEKIYILLQDLNNGL